MKAILMSIKPQYVAKILNGEKTIEIRKKFPKDYVGWVYIYCTKEQGLARLLNNGSWVDTFKCEKNLTEKDFKRMRSDYDGKGKVVARFWCDKVEKVHCNSYGLETSEHWYRTTGKNEKELLNECALTFEELDDYLCFGNGYAIHINDLEIFDKPKEISEFSIKVFPHRKDNLMTRYLTRAPQSWCYIEI